MSFLDKRTPADFPVLPDQPVWVFVPIFLALLAIPAINTIHFGWLHRRWPGLFRSRALLAAILPCVVVVGMIVNTPGEIRKAWQTRSASK